jgi:hypothetical protein
MRNARNAAAIGSSIKRHVALRSLVSAVIMVSTIAAAHAAPAPQPAEGADRSQSNEDALSKWINQENARIDRLINGICRGC